MVRTYDIFTKSSLEKEKFISLTLLGQSPSSSKKREMPPAGVISGYSLAYSQNLDMVSLTVGCALL